MKKIPIIIGSLVLSFLIGCANNQKSFNNDPFPANVVHMNLVTDAIKENIRKYDYELGYELFSTPVRYDLPKTRIEIHDDVLRIKTIRHMIAYYLNSTGYKITIEGMAPKNANIVLDLPVTLYDLPGTGKLYFVLAKHLPFGEYLLVDHNNKLVSVGKPYRKKSDVAKTPGETTNQLVTNDPFEMGSSIEEPTFIMGATTDSVKQRFVEVRGKAIDNTAALQVESFFKVCTRCQYSAIAIENSRSTAEGYIDQIKKIATNIRITLNNTETGFPESNQANGLILIRK